MTEGHRPALALVVAVAVFALVAVLLLQLPVSSEEGRARPGGLLALSRTNLSLCVDNADGSLATQAQIVAVATAVDQALRSIPEVPTEFGQPSVVGGCPPPIPVTGEELDSAALCCSFARVVTDQTLSPHLVFVYYVRDDVYSASLGEAPYSRALSELVCRDPPGTPPPLDSAHIGWRDNLCAARTFSLYVPSSASVDTLAEGVLYTIGLYPAAAAPTFDPQGFVNSCEQGTPVLGCDRYTACMNATPNPECDEFWQEIGIEPPQ